MNILYCGDEGIKDGVLVSILSILKHNSTPLHIYITTINYQSTKPFTDKSTDFLNALVKAKNPKSFVKKLDATAVFAKNLPEKNMKSYFTPCSMLRLYADQIPELKDLEKILYLDYDVVCRGNLTELYNIDLKNLEAAGVLDLYGQHFYHYHGLRTRDYMNSGVMLFNLPECKKSKMFKKAVELCQSRRMMLADQAALNKAIKNRKLLPRKFNEQSERPRQDTLLHHFSNNFKFLPIFHVQKVKPFEIEKIHKILKITEYDDILETYQTLRGQL